jgi:hypothetical protein
MKDYSLLTDSQLIEQLLVSHQDLIESDLEDADALDNLDDAKYEMEKRLFISRVGFGLLTAIDKGVDCFSLFDEEGFKDKGDVLQQILHNVDAHVCLMNDVFEGNIDLDDAYALVDRSINSYGQIQDDSEDEGSDEEED